ncbi:tetratricopeptide repeat protein [Amycolatopsis sp. NPDC004368]
MKLFRARTAPAPADETARLREALVKARNPESQTALHRKHHLGVLLMTAAEWSAAEAVFAELAPVQGRVLGPRHPSTLAAWTNLALSQAQQGRPDEAVPVLARTAEVYERTWGAKERGTFEARLHLAHVLVVAARFTEALDVLDTHRRSCAAELGPAHAVTLATAARKVALLCELDRHEEAEREAAELITLATTDLARDRMTALGLVIRAERGDSARVVAPLRELLARHGTRGLRAALATAMLRAGEAEEAAALLSSVLAAGPKSSHRSLLVRGELARAHLEAGHLDDAEREATAVLAARAWPAGHPALLTAQATLARAAHRRGRRAEAIEGLEAVITGFSAVLGPDHSCTVEAAGWLGEV